MKMRKGVIAIVVFFIIAGISQFVYACDGTRDNSEQKTMNAYGREGFKKASDQNIDFSLYTDSASLDVKAWEAFNAKDYATAQAFAQETINRYNSQAKEQQASLSGFAPEGSESQYWALNDVATAFFISASVYKAQGDNAKAKEQFNAIISQYRYAQCYDPAQDIYWKVAEAAQKELDSL